MLSYPLKLRSVAAITLLFSLLASTTQGAYSRDQSMTVERLNGIDIAYTTTGDPEGPAVLMVMGLTGSHRLWGEALINDLADAGFRVILFDNRDTGESARLDDLGTPTLWWELFKNWAGFDVDAPYTLSDMAKDGIAVLDTLDVEQAHVVGASMGGMIAQIIAAEYPERTLSLVSIMSTTGAPHLPPAEDQASDSLLNIASAEGDASSQLQDIGIFPEAMPRQLMAIIAAGDRTVQVQTITAPTLVLHGENDTLLPPPHGEHTHENISGSRYVVYPDMGHDMPSDVIPLIVQDMVGHFEAAETSP
jgi:pimeloyl-ACP methyl ester carboxylesterase